ncbi:hypothetical protein AVEN_61173-1 [Araneus ventricosus]|uniref:Transposase IS30-like HTH domain-containing protein n=1 Tax=Araneus ventricosus TaxID=182803 RepID=A0A4Y2Q5U4_ARAVE|nr:hypothetical protein AVEN_53794-1 [Araneus ventricosus]GBN59508.1 hypothetical protein AVEN_61173-1 [Araneus ventricosus]
MGKAAHLSEFDRGQIVMAQRLGTSITETARLVGCSRYAVVSIQENWINDGDTSSRRQDVGRPRDIRERGRRRLSRLVKQNWRQAVTQLTAQYSAESKRKCFGTHCSADTVGYGTVYQTSHSCSFIDQVSSSTTFTVGPGTSRLDHG